MTNVLLIIFTISLLYLGIAHRLLTYIKILAIQGVILFGIAFIELIQINAINLAFVLVETIVFKAIAIPLFLNYVMKRNRLTRDAEPFLPNFISLIIITLTIIATFILSLAVGNEMPMLVNLGIMLDIFASVFLLGIFVNRIGDVLKDVDVDQLKNLKD